MSLVGRQQFVFGIYCKNFRCRYIGDSCFLALCIIRNGDFPANSWCDGSDWQDIVI